MSTHTSVQSKAARANVSDGFSPEDVKNLSSVLNANEQQSGGRSHQSGNKHQQAK